MQRRNFTGALFGAIVVPLLASGCVEAQSGGYPPVPAARREQMPPPPRGGDRFVWQPGHWHWNGRAYEWLPGRYVEYSQHRGGRWVPGHWVQRGREQIWVPGGWV